MALCGGGCGCGKGWMERWRLQSVQDAAGLGGSERLLPFPARAEGKGCCLLYIACLHCGGGVEGSLLQSYCTCACSRCSSACSHCTSPCNTCTSACSNCTFPCSNCISPMQQLQLSMEQLYLPIAAIAALHAALAAVPCSICTPLCSKPCAGGTACAGGRALGCPVPFCPLKDMLVEVRVLRLGGLRGWESVPAAGSRSQPVALGGAGCL